MVKIIHTWENLSSPQIRYLDTMIFSVNIIRIHIIPRKKVCQFSNLSELNFKFQLFPQKYDTRHCKLLKHNALSTQTDVAWDLILEKEPISSKSRTVLSFFHKRKVHLNIVSTQTDVAWSQGKKKRQYLPKLLLFFKYRRKFFKNANILICFKQTRIFKLLPQVTFNLEAKFAFVWEWRT